MYMHTDVTPARQPPTMRDSSRYILVYFKERYTKYAPLAHWAHSEAHLVRLGLRSPQLPGCFPADLAFLVGQYLSLRYGTHALRLAALRRTP